MKFGEFPDTRPSDNDEPAVPAGSELKTFKEQTSAPVDLDGAPPPRAPVEPRPEQRQSEVGRPPSIQRRLERLTATKNELSRELEAIRAERDLFREQAELLRARQSPGARFEAAPARTQNPTGGDIWGEPDGSAVEQTRGPRNQDVADLLTRELAPVRDFIQQEHKRRTDEQQRAEIYSAQQQSYEAAVSEFPELSQRGSALYRYTDEILKRDPELQRHRDGPYRAALMARGLLAEEAQTDRRQQDVQRAAATINHDSGVGSAENTLDRDFQTEYAKALKQLRSDTGRDVWLRARNAQQALLGNQGV